jgi:diguanylate cyclase (GGDEF)-like protein/PAS domain S-box-containing protein
MLGLHLHSTTPDITNPALMIPKLPPPTEVLDLIPDAVCVVDTEGRFLFVNASFERIFGYAPDEVLGQQAFDLVHPDDRAATRQQAEQVNAGTLQRHFRNRYVHKDGHSVDIQWSARWLPDYGVRIGVGREVTELRQAERELEHRASHDPLTGLPNRHQLQSELQYAIAHAAQTGDGLAVLYLDLDGFKEVNDRGGHDAGDRLLREVAQRLQQGLRQGDLVARVGGDEFVALLPGCRDANTARAVADGIRARLSPRYTLPDGLFRLDASIGIACFPADGSDLDALLAHADHAMYVDKRQRPQRGDADLAHDIPADT